MSDKSLIVSLPSRSVGELSQRRRGGLIEWRPDAAWENDGQEPRLGLDFLRTRGGRRHASELPAWFENLLPERDSELRARLCELHGLRDGQSFPLMQSLGRDLIGAVEVRCENHKTDEHSEAVAGRPNLTRGSDAEQVAANDENRFSALTGMQLKFSMSMVNERLVLHARRGAAQWIVKIAGLEYDELAEVETATMTWARRSSFDVPDHATVPVSRLDGLPIGWVERPAPAFAVRRFDRRDDGAKVHQEDFCQALGLRPRDKYGDSKDARVSFDGALRLTTDACGEDEGREMARRIGFMIASGNTDAHLKNWSFRWGERTRPTLTPCYDLVTTIAWEKMGWRRRGGPTLALRLGNVERFGSLNEVALDNCAEASGAAWAKMEILAGIERARGAWLSVREGAPVRMRSAIDQHWQEVPILARMGLTK